MARSLSGSPYLTLDDYRKEMHIPMCVFNGVENPDEPVSGCDSVFMQWQRDAIAQALVDAEGDLASIMGYWIGERYLVNEGLVFTDPMALPWGWINGGGIEGLAEVTPSASDFTTDPATITVAQASFPGGISEIKIVEDETDLVITPDSVDEVGANYVIYISQCKLIEWDDLEDQSVAIDYDDTYPAATWLKLADLTVYRSYLDTSSQATITFGPSCHCTFCGTACSGDSYDGCIYVINPEISKVRIQIATYDADEETWTCNYPLYTGCYSGDKVTARYLAGHLPAGWKRAIIRLANTKLPFAPCGCAAFDFLMQRDRRIPSVLTGQRINCPLGLEDGAWAAWTWAQNLKNVPAFML